MSSFGRRAKEAFSIPITTFPESLHPLLKEIDGPDGNGSLETDELTEVFEMYAAAKKANEEGCIALKSLPQDLQKTLQVFDVDGDGTVGTAELARAAELYQDSKNGETFGESSCGAFFAHGCTCWHDCWIDGARD